MEEMCVLSPTGVLGSGFLETSFESAFARKPHFIGCDAGSIDPGPGHRGALPPAAARREVFFCDNALAIKASIPRPHAQGDLSDADGHGGQQYAPLMDIEVP